MLFRSLIEGTLVSRIDFGPLARIGYNPVQSWAIRTPKSAPGGGGIVIVFLTNPPPVSWGLTAGRNTAPLTRNLKIRLVARFYTVFQSPNRNGKPSAYPVFVGHGAVFPRQPTSSNIALRPLLLGTLILVMIVAYVIMLVIRFKRGRKSRRPSPPDEIGRAHV